MTPAKVNLYSFDDTINTLIAFIQNGHLKQRFLPINPNSPQKMFIIVISIISIRNNAGSDLISFIRFHHSFNQTNQSNIMNLNHTLPLFLFRRVIQSPHIPNQKIHVGEKPLIKTSSSSPIFPFPLLIKRLSFSSNKAFSITFCRECEKVPDPLTFLDSNLPSALANK